MMRSIAQHWVPMAALACGAGLIAGVPAIAAPITVQNASFESPEIGDTPSKFINSNISGWVKIAGNQPDLGVLLNTYSGMPATTPDGVQWMYVAVGGTFSVKAMSQDVTTIASDSTYTLNVTVGATGAIAPGFTVALYTDDGVTHTPSVALASKTNADVTFTDKIAPATVTLDTTTIDSDYLGRHLYIYLGYTAQVSGQASQLLFDTVSLDVSAVPEPASLSILALGALSLLARRRRMTKLGQSI